MAQTVAPMTRSPKITPTGTAHFPITIVITDYVYFIKG